MILFWDFIAYLALAALFVGLWWRYRYDKFGWTTRSSESYESKLLAIGSPLFHYGILAVVAGHFMGLVIPQSWTESVGVDEHSYHLVAVWGGLAAAAATVTGLAILIFRRRTNRAVFRATTRNDKFMYVVLAAVIGAGVATTLYGSGLFTEDAYNYRGTVSVWFRSIFVFQPDGALMAQTPFSYQLHIALAMGLFVILPFTRLVHIFSAPIQYLFRPYILYRSRKVRPGAPVSRSHTPGWSDGPVG